MANIIKGVNQDGSVNVKQAGSYVRLSTESKPTEAQDGNSLLEVDTGNVYIFYQGQWRLM